MSESAHPFPCMSRSRKDVYLFPELNSSVDESVHLSQEMSSSTDESVHLFSGMNTQLYEAAFAGNVYELNKFIEGKDKLNIFQEFTALGNSVLHIAVSRGNLGSIEKLFIEVVNRDLVAGREFLRAKNSQGNTALHLAAFHRRDELVEKLAGLMEGDPEAGDFLRSVNSEGNTVLHEGARGGNCKVVEVLLKHDARNHDDLISLPNDAGETALFVASESGYADIVDKLLPFMDTNSNMKRGDGQTPLHSAVFYGHTGVVKKLLVHNPGLAKQTDKRGRTALHMLSLTRKSVYCTLEKNNSRIKGCLRMIICSRFETPLKMITELLLKEDNSLCYKQDDKKQTPLHIAVEEGKYELVKLLINYGGDSRDLVDNDGRTPLHLAVKNARRISDSSLFSKLRSYRNMLSSLVTKWSLNHRDNRGQTPVQTALENISSDEGLYKSIRNLLLQYKGTLMTPEILEDERRIEPSSVLSRIKAENISINAVLIATVSFAAAFTLPGGLVSEQGENPKAVFINSVLFKLFLICDTFSFCSSIASAILVQYRGSGKREEEFLVQCSLLLLWSALISLVVAFGAAVHLVIAPSPWLAGIVWTMVSLAPSAISMVLSGSNNVHGEVRYLHWMLFPSLLLMPLNCVLVILYTIYYIFWFADIINDLTRCIIKLLKRCRARILKVRDQ